MNSYKL